MTEGAPLDTHYHSDIPDCIAILASLRDLPADVVYPVHYNSLNRARLVEIIDEYITGKRKPDCPVTS